MQNAIGKVNVYCCGGAGLNIGGKTEEILKKQQSGVAKTNFVYVDTSASNLTNSHPKENVFIIENIDGENLDGSGKSRKENHVRIGESVHSILLNYKPEDLNIVVSSTSGGSGSVIAPSLVKELLSRDATVIVIAVSSQTSSIEIDNTIKTLKSYEAISQNLQVPVPMVYIENKPGKKRSESDDEAFISILKFCILFSRQNKELDSADLRNWLNYTKVTSYDPHLVTIDFFDEDIKVNGVVLTIATLASVGDDTSPGGFVDYQCVGFLSSEAAEQLGLKKPLHFAVIGDVFGDIIKDLGKRLAEREEIKRASVRKVSILSGNDKATDSGIVL